MQDYKQCLHLLKVLPADGARGGPLLAADGAQQVVLLARVDRRRRLKNSKSFLSLTVLLFQINCLTVNNLPTALINNPKRASLNTSRAKHSRKKNNS